MSLGLFNWHSRQNSHKISPKSETKAVSLHHKTKKPAKMSEVELILVRESDKCTMYTIQFLSEEMSRTPRHMMKTKRSKAMSLTSKSLRNCWKRGWKTEAWRLPKQLLKLTKHLRYVLLILNLWYHSYITLFRPLCRPFWHLAVYHSVVMPASRLRSKQQSAQKC